MKYTGRDHKQQTGEHRGHPCDKSCRDAEYADRRPAGKIRPKVNNPPDKIKQAAQEEQQITRKISPRAGQ
ncbi:hypothetical protein AusDCA_2464 [Desulfitobacterium sp. AusDCA]